jgi:putative ABC transport system substrate-binding protein
LLGGAAAAWPVAARGQQPDGVRHLGILIGSAENAELHSRLSVFRQSLQQLGWIEGRNLRISFRWGGGDAERTATQARQLVKLGPDVIFTGPTNAVIPLQLTTRTIPIVFVSVSDPLGQGIVDSLARPTGNVTGFSNLEFSLIGKWLQILKEATPGLKRVGLMISSANASSPKWYQTFNTIAPTFAIEPLAVPFEKPAEIDGIIRDLARQPSSAMIVAGDNQVESPRVRRQVVTLTATHRLPTLYGVLSFISEGGFLVYGIDPVEPYRQAAGYVHRILNGDRPSDLPIQQPTKFHFAINLKTAKALGLDPSPLLVGTADEVIE